MPMRPTSVALLSLPMPTTTVMKMIGAITIRTSLTKPMANGFICSPMLG